MVLHENKRRQQVQFMRLCWKENNSKPLWHNEKETSKCYLSANQASFNEMLQCWSCNCGKKKKKFINLKFCQTLLDILNVKHLDVHLPKCDSFSNLLYHNYPNIEHTIDNTIPQINTVCILK